MFDWINDVPDLVWGAIVTGLFLTGQQVLNNRREDRRRIADATEREKDRTHQAQQAKEERDHQASETRAERDHQSVVAARLAADTRAEQWREERRTAHLRLLPLLEDAVQQLSKGLGRVPKNENGMVKPGDPIDCLQGSTKEDIAQAVADVQLIGSEKSRNCAKDCRDKIGVADIDIFITTLVAKPEKSGTFAELQQRVSSAEESLAAYVDAVRVDLGTAD